MNSVYKRPINKQSPSPPRKLFSKTRKNISRNYPENILKAAAKTISIKTETNFWSGHHAQSGSIEPEEDRNEVQKFRKPSKLKKLAISTSVNKLPKRNFQSTQSFQRSHHH